MLFNSFEFAFFLVIVFIFYWFVFEKNLTYQNLLLLVSSYIFYAWWDARFLILIVFSSTLDYNLSLRIQESRTKVLRKSFLIFSLIGNLGLLFIFKYYNFFADSLKNSLFILGYNIDDLTLDIILPVGISFYTFQTLSYTIDVYKGEVKATKSWIEFFAFVSFFPQLVAGPIERASHLLPQLQSTREFHLQDAKDGLRQILWGLVKKLVIADSCGLITNEIFDTYQGQSSLMLCLGLFFFSFQIYGDFSGYSDIAIGSAKLLGIHLNKNFNFPYFSTSISEFWRRWHISLSSWFRDYVYFPLGGSRVVGKILKFRNIALVFLISGLWHGANWTFIIWGGINALLFVPYFFFEKSGNSQKNSSNESIFPGLREIYRVLITFCLVCITWVFFRATSINEAFSYLRSIVMNDTYFSIPRLGILETGFYVFLFIIIEWFHRNREHGLDFYHGTPIIFRWVSYLILSSLVFNGILGGSEDFVYFQF